MKLNIKNMSVIQKAVISLSLSLVIISIFLHNPLSGYIESNKYETAYRDDPCTEQYKNQVRKNYKEVWIKNEGDKPQSESHKKFVESAIHIVCNDKKEAYQRIASVPFNEIRSIKPIYLWFGYLANIIQLIVVICLVAGITFFFSSPRQEN